MISQVIKDSDFLDNLEDNVDRFLLSLRKPDRSGCYFPCRSGRTKLGGQAELGLSCFALKIYHTLGWWSRTDRTIRSQWIDHIQSFQLTREGLDPQFQNAFIDPVLVDYLREPSVSQFFSRLRSTSLQELVKGLFYESTLKPYQRAIVAETKQAIATLAEVGEAPTHPFSSFPHTPKDVHNYMAGFDWSLPWGAGGQTAGLTVFLVTQAPRLYSPATSAELQAAAGAFFRSILDDDSGGYFQGRPPSHGLLVNGAMKVLTALDWLKEPIHLPERLIDTVLQYPPRADGCHLVDAVYVLYRCTLQKKYRHRDVNTYLLNCLSMIREHQQLDGGFSYGVNQAQKWYYGLPISRGVKEGDMHGTVLLTWALAMITTVVWPGKHSWQILKP